MINSRLTVILVEDHPITRLGIASMLAKMPEIELVAEVGDGTEALDCIINKKPDIVLMDIGLPGMDGIELTKAIKRAIETKIVMVTSHDNDEDILAALAAGADGYCLKGVTLNQMRNVIEAVYGGALWFDPGIAKRVLDMISLRPAKRSTSVSLPRVSANLSARELEVLALVVEGLSNHEIAQRLWLSAETVKTHLRHVMEKLQVNDRTQAAVKAVREGLLASK